MRTRLKSGDMGSAACDLRGVKVTSVALRENELRIDLRGGAASWSMTLRGIIAFLDSGVTGRPLGGYVIEDRGSFKEIRIQRASGGTVFRCEYMEGEITSLKAIPAAPGPLRGR